MKTAVSRRGVKGGKRPDTQQMKEWLSKGHVVTSLGVVRKFPEHNSHYEISTEEGRREILVDVELVPSGTRTMCRLGFGNDQSFKIPRVDQEVAVLLPFDPQSLIKDPLDFEAIIVGVLDVDVPSEVTGDGDHVIKASNKVTIDAPTVTCGAEVGSESAVKGQTYRSAEDTLLTALTTALTALAAMLTANATSSSAPGTPTQQAATATASTAAATAVSTAITAITTFKSAGSTYLAQQAKVT
jgi:hypothetical protein